LLLLVGWIYSEPNQSENNVQQRHNIIYNEHNQSENISNSSLSVTASEATIDQMKKEESIGNQRRRSTFIYMKWKHGPDHSSRRRQLQLPPLATTTKCPQFPCSADASSSSHAPARPNAVAVIEDTPEVALRPRRMVELMPRRREQRAARRGKMAALGGGAEATPDGGEVGRREARQGIGRPRAGEDARA
jgi:hypothetical protein